MTRRLAMIFGVVFLLFGVLGLITEGGMSMAADPAPAALLGVFPVNLLHNLVHLTFGIWGLVASRSFAGSRMYGLTGGAIYLVLACLGFIAPTTFGLIPIGGNDIWLHAVLGIGLLAMGLTARDDTPRTVAA